MHKKEKRCKKRKRQDAAAHQENKQEEGKAEKSSSEKHHQEVTPSTKLLSNGNVATECDNNHDDNDSDALDQNQTNHSRKKAKKAERDSRRAERKRLMQQVPEVDENGVAYTKLERRRMRKRVARGLDPIETEAEKQERLMREKELRKEEEAELAGLVISSKTSENAQDSEDDHQADDSSHEEEEKGSNSQLEESENEVYNNDRDDEVDDDDNDQRESISKTKNMPKDLSPKKAHKPRSKPVPPDYTCLACQNKHAPAHWIYDCPDKITKPGTNQIAKKFKGIHNPDPRKVFVSGLPFDAKTGDVTKLFAPTCGKIVHCKLIKFEDTGRCKGQAYITFETDEGALKALQLSGSTIDNEVPSSAKKQEAKSQRSELKLKVTKALNRFLTKANNKK